MIPKNRCKICKDSGPTYSQRYPNFDGWCRTCFVRYRFLVDALKGIGAANRNAERMLRSLMRIDHSWTQGEVRNEARKFQS